MPTRLKFCGLTRPEDVAQAAELGAEYVGVIFAGGARNRTVTQARALFQEAGSLRRVGVVARASEDTLRGMLDGVPLDVVQLHGDAQTAARAAGVVAARVAGAREVWAVIRLDGTELPCGASELFQCADAVVLDTRGSTGLGGTGRIFDWEAIGARLAALPAEARRARLVVAGGLTPENVADAIRLLRPDVVDVSSGVESSPGVKDHSSMRRFADAVRSV